MSLNILLSKFMKKTNTTLRGKATPYLISNDITITDIPMLYDRVNDHLAVRGHQKRAKTTGLSKVDGLEDSHQLGIGG
ncbi:hypothetical protein M5689_003403 [Euphorbia peplus]|nr:hypothetical protein M5689_003403 [Euphorbia peplus]